MMVISSMWSPLSGRRPRYDSGMLQPSGVALTIVLIVGASLVLPGRAAVQNPADWTEPFPPFRIAGNLYYVGSRGLASYLVTTAQGHILINSNLEEGVPLIRGSVEKLGFKFSDIRILLINQGHWDHDAGSALVKKLTGAQYMVMEGDVSVVESGGKTDFHYGGDQSTHYPPAKVDRVLRDGDRVTLGDAVLTARLTPGHTRGCTTWTMDVKEGAAVRQVVIVGGVAVNPGFRLVDNPAYPEIARDYERTFAVLESLKGDYFLGAHGSYYDMEAKYARQAKGDANAFVDPGGYRKLVAGAKGAFEREWAKQKGLR